MLLRGLRPRCETCALAPACAAAGAVRAEYPQCWAAPRPLALERVRAHWGRCFPATGGPCDAQERALGELVLARVREDNARWSELYEPSLSAGPDGVSLARFSYGLPHFAADPKYALRALRAFAEPFGPAVREGVERASRAALKGRRFVEQVLFGYAREGDLRRVKVYLQFRSGEGRRALELARLITGHQGVYLSGTFLPLHLLGLDLGDEGLAGAKLYFSDGERTIPSFFATQSTRARDVLWVHRLRGPDDASSYEAVDTDFAVGPGDMTWEWLVSQCAPLRATGAPEALAALGDSFHLGVRRVSISCAAPYRANVYYTLLETGVTEPTARA